MRHLIRRLPYVAFAVLLVFAALHGCMVFTGSTDGYVADTAECTGIGTPLEVPTAASDSGATTSACISCLRNECGEQFAVCEADCPCRENALRLFACLEKGGVATDCVTPDAGVTLDEKLIAIAGCVQRSPCLKSSCGAALGDAAR